MPSLPRTWEMKNTLFGGTPPAYSHERLLPRAPRAPNSTPCLPDTCPWSCEALAPRVRGGLGTPSVENCFGHHLELLEVCRGYTSHSSDLGSRSIFSKLGVPHPVGTGLSREGVGAGLCCILWEPRPSNPPKTGFFQGGTLFSARLHPEAFDIWRPHPMHHTRGTFPYAAAKTASRSGN